jgi:hypothetical protein
LFNEDAITVQGLPWCLEAPKTIGMSSFVRNILCRAHNSQLSNLDTAALGAFNAFRESVRLNEAREGLRAEYLTIKRFVINGPLLERWFLKTLINVSFGGKWIIGNGTHAKGVPSDDLVQTVFGLRDFQSGAGLYIASHAGEQIDSMDRVNIIPKTDGNTLAAAGFNFRGYRFFLNLLPQKFDMDGQSHLFYRDSQMKFQIHNSKGRLLLSHEIKFKWKIPT